MLKPLIKRIRRKLRNWKNTRRVKESLRKYKNRDTYQIEFNDCIVYFDSTDNFSKLWYHNSNRTSQYHEPHLTNQFISLIKEGDIVFDVGSLIGYFTCLASELVGEKGEVHAFEIDKDCMPLIEKSLVLAKHKNATIHHVAVCDHKGKERMTQTVRLKLGEMLSNKEEKTSIEIDATTIDHFVKENGVSPDLIKIDVEGSEFRVIKGMQQLLLKGKVKLLIEIHVKKLQQFYNVHYKELIQFLHDMDYILELIPEDNKLVKRLIVDQNTLLEDNSLIYAFREEKLDGT